MPAINSRSERGSVQLAELSLLLAAVRGPPNPPVRLPKGRTEPSRIVIPSSRDREFEPVSLQRRVRCEPDFRGRIPSMIVGVPTSGASLLTGDRGFESTSLQRGVSCEPASQGLGFKRLVWGNLGDDPR